MTFYTDSAEQTIEFGKKIGSKLKKGDILAMQGTILLLTVKLDWIIL